ncbi:MAG TPA: ABC transporter permease [Coriobacteriia bacterium]|nr:ABC transporter permease [Coriobacteriia bacterium]
MFSEVFTPELFASAVRLATPIALAAIGATICERSGVVNIAMEGLMLVAAFFGVAVTLLAPGWGVPVALATWLGVFAAIVGGTMFSALHAWASVNLQADQVISGTAINILALGATGFLMETIFKHPGTTDSVERLKPVFDFPAGGQGAMGTLWTWIDVVFLSYTPLVYLGMFLAVFLTWALYRTRWGLRLRALGEHPRAADTVGVDVYRGRWMAVLISGAMAGLAGANLTLEQVGAFTENMTNGRGFIALAAMIFGRWIPGGAYLASLLFGFADALQLKLQIFSNVIKIPPQFFLMLPYLLTVLVLAGVVGRSVAPAADGKPYSKKA